MKAEISISLRMRSPGPNESAESVLRRLAGRTVLQIIPALDAGGAERTTVDIAEIQATTPSDTGVGILNRSMIIILMPMKPSTSARPYGSRWKRSSGATGREGPRMFHRWAER